MPYNKLLTYLSCSSHTGEYWPFVVFFGQTLLCSGHTKTSAGQCSLVPPSVSEKLIILLVNNHVSKKEASVLGTANILQNFDTCTFMMGGSLPERKQLDEIVSQNRYPLLIRTNYEEFLRLKLNFDVT